MSATSEIKNLDRAGAVSGKVGKLGDLVRVVPECNQAWQKVALKQRTKK